MSNSIHGWQAGLLAAKQVVKAPPSPISRKAQDYTAALVQAMKQGRTEMNGWPIGKMIHGAT